ncbi:MAG TPA: septal ring lytic transglycosylase RlpA family protein [Candidatus Acidoferrales bacterium]|jgi:rare lipoprotein A (peptidoglycan hydrolase)|nr:septal ring lytic transglycosylase RlpA family protein [Candidatus Acidoferrales bacterium]
MRNKLFMVWAASRWLLLMFLFTPALQAPLVARPSEPIKPLKVWEGTASWYGSNFHGRKTSNGEIYDMNAPTAAHQTLPFGSLVRLVDLKSGKSQIVRINDRGPFVEGRELDVSARTAVRLGMQERGVARLRLELLEVPKRR